MNVPELQLSVHRHFDALMSGSAEFVMLLEARLTIEGNQAVVADELATCMTRFFEQ
jgi:hypothetical protein